jgi:catechol 2,3-dioxygenase-like lactoylglutathione lyase family enzyme
VAIRLGAVALDCEDPVGLMRFYGALLDAAVAVESERFAAVRLPGLWLTAHRVDGHEAPTWPGGPSPKQAHLDLRVDDVAAATARALGLGATRPTPLPETPESFVTLRDPAGHPFCLTTMVPDPDDWTADQVT